MPPPRKNSKFSNLVSVFLVIQRILCRRKELQKTLKGNIDYEIQNLISNELPEIVLKETVRK
jgi:hypothetical protein